MGIDATRSEGNTDKLSGYLEGFVDGQKRGMEIMKSKACQEFSKILAEICPNLIRCGEELKSLSDMFRKRLEE